MEWTHTLDRIIKDAELESVYEQARKTDPDLALNLEKIADQYERARTSYRSKCEATARNLLMMILSDDNLKEIHSATYRVKTTESLIGKYIRKKAVLPAKQGDDYDIEKYRPMSGANFHKIITDLIGIRILIRYPQQWRMVHEWIFSNFFKGSERYIKNWIQDYPRDNTEDFIVEQPKLYVRYENEISSYMIDGQMIFQPKISSEGYSSLHYLIWYDGKYAEIQVRTVFDEAWGECTHDLVYKCKNKVRKRELERLSVCLASQTQSAGMIASLMYDKAFSEEEQEEIMEGHTVIDQEEERTYRMLEKRIHGMMELGKQVQDFDGSVDKLIEE